MKSIKSKVLTLVVSGMLLITVAIGTIVSLYLGSILNSDSNAITDQVAETESSKINDILLQMEYTVKMMENFIVYSFEDPHKLSDEKYRSAYVQDMKHWIINTVGRDTSGVASYFLRIAPELSDGTSGFFVAIRDGGEHFEDIPVTDLTDWENGNIAPWYSEPARKGHSTWIMPYDGGMNHDNVITYSTPIYKDGVFVGVIGMEIDFSYITSMVQTITVYDNGFAYLTDSDHNLVYSPVSEHQLEKSHSDHGYAEEHRDLNNGMHLILHVDYVDMQRNAYSLLGTVAFVAFLMIAVFIAITIILTKRIIKPLNDLAISADSIVDGKYDMQLDQSVDAEIYAVGNALKRTADKVSNYMNYINALAYRDALTGVKNVAAYNEMTVDIERRMRSGEKLNFAIMVADINMLKLTNDVFGHEIGNQLIIKAAKIICTTFKHSPVFRIGGDEFVVLLENSDLENVDSLIERMDSHCSREFVSAGEQNISISIARGISVYNSEFHIAYADVFDRADREMYAHKSTVKGELEKNMADFKKE